jgi:hypothetical protein
MILDSVGAFRERRINVRDVIIRLLSSTVSAEIEEMVLNTDTRGITIVEGTMASCYAENPPTVTNGPIFIRDAIGSMLRFPMDALVHELILIPKGSSHKLVVTSKGLEVVNLIPQSI